MAPERRLIPEDDPSQTTSTARIQCTSNVVGVIPPQIHEILIHQDATVDPSSQRRLRGRVDDHSSGISFLLGQGREESNAISLWEHSTQTLNEELVAPSGLCVKLTHPEHTADNDTDGIDESLLVACLGPDNTNDHTHGGGGRMYGRDQARSLRHVYAASPTTGVLCVWVLDNANRTNSEAECDASVRLKLKQGELLTSLTPMGGVGGDTWLLASTSMGRLWKIYKTSRPLTLHAKLVKKKMIAQNSVNGPTTVEEEETAGIVRGLYNYFTTPSKKASSSVDNTPAVDEGTNMNASEDEEGIVALVPLPAKAFNDEGEMPQTSAPGRSPQRSPTNRSPPPRKQARISSMSSLDTSCARILSLSSSLVLKKWKVSLLAGVESKEGGEGCTLCTTLFPRHPDGTLDLSSLLRSNNNSSEMEDSLEGYRQVEMLAAPSLAKDGKSLLMVIRIAKANDVDATRAYVVRIALGGNSPYILDAAWLDRYAGPTLAQNEGTLECAGLVVAEASEEESAVGVDGCMAYVGFGPRGDTGPGRLNSPVTISAVYFSPVNEQNQQQQMGPRVKDLDLFSNIVPSAIQNSMSYDSLTGGCVFLATSGLLCGAYVRFPPLQSLGPNNSMTMVEGREGVTAGTYLDNASLALLAQDENVLTIKSHLQSAFRQYLHKLNEAGSNAARALVPPSIATCPAHVLSAAAVLASTDFVCLAGGTGGMASSSPFSPSGRTGNATPVTVLRDKLRTHTDFVTFLLHAGAYRRVSTAGRVKLRDHGEMITASRALLIECQNYFSQAEKAAGDDDRRNELARVRQMVTTALEGASENVLGLPQRWAGLQSLSSAIARDDGAGGRDMLLLTSSSICQGIGQALRYRQNESGSLYDVPSYESSSSTSYGWTSSRDVLDVLCTQLHSIQQGGESMLSSSVDYDSESASLRRYVEDIAASALSGHRDIASREAESDEAVRAYEETKSLAVPLLRQYANDMSEDGEGGNDLIALQTSLAHAYFEGIIQICYDHRQSWRYRGPYSDQKADERYDLRDMIAGSSDGSPYAHLHHTRDYHTGLSFCEYVLRWYSDRGYYPEVFELGKNCPHDLARYVRNDNRLSHLAWIEHLQDGGHEQATVGLMSLNSPILFNVDNQQHSSEMTLWEKDQMMSLAKLSNKLAHAKSANMARSANGQQRNELIDNSLTLISAQRILQEDTAMGDEIALKQDDLLRLAVEKIQASRDIDQLKRFGICGLAIASAKHPNQEEAMADEASTIWNVVIQADIHTWQSVANDNGMAVGGLSEEELIQRVESTAFVGVICDFLTSSDQKTMRNVGFFNDLVKNRVFGMLGSEELLKVLMLSAEIALAAN